MKEMTDRQHEIYAFISRYIKDNSFPPTIREIGDKFGISVKGAYDHLKALEKKNIIKLGDNKSRAITLILEDDLEEGIPLIGYVAAGKPIMAEETLSEHVIVPKEMTANAKCFALKVRGDSMRDAGILSGDIAVIEQRSTASDGEIVVALVEDAATLKRFYKEASRIRLQAENPDYPPIYTRDVKILGKLKGIIRNYS